MDLQEANEKLEAQLKERYKILGNASKGRAEVISARQTVEYSMGKINTDNYHKWQKAYNDELKRKLN